MPRAVISTSYDFVFARLHGVWANAVQGEALKRLMGCATEENLARALTEYGIETGSHLSFHKRLAERQLQFLSDFQAMAGPGLGDYLDEVILNIANENLKILLNYRFFPERETEISDLLMHIPGHPGYDVEALLGEEHLETFILMLTHGREDNELAEIVRGLHRSRDLMEAECAIDARSFRHQLEAARHVPLSVRPHTTALVRGEIDITNIIVLLRNANLYRLPAEQMAKLLIPGGELLTEAALEGLLGVSTVAGILQRLPSRYSDCFPFLSATTELYRLENALWNGLARRAMVLFRNFNRPLLSLVAFPYLLRFETLNIGRIYEGIRFSLPPQAIAAMMIGDVP